MLSYADHLAIARERSEALAYAQPIAASFAAAGKLIMPNLSLSERPMKRVLCRNDDIERMLVEVSTSMWSLPVELLRWAEALGTTTIHCKRRRHVDVCLYVMHLDDTFGLHWQISAATRWPDRGQLPGIDQPWRRHRDRITDDGSMPVADLRTTLTALGYPTEDT